MEAGVVGVGKVFIKTRGFWYPNPDQKDPVGSLFWGVGVRKVPLSILLQMTHEGCVQLEGGDAHKDVWECSEKGGTSGA